MKKKAKSFKNVQKLDQWMSLNSESETELLVQVYRKDSKVPSVTWNDCVLVSLRWGWIDSTRYSLDEKSWLQRLSPRRPKSNWSIRNCNFARQMIKYNLMSPLGMTHVKKAKKNGQWKNKIKKNKITPKEQQLFQDFMEKIN